MNITEWLAREAEQDRADGFGPHIDEATTRAIAVMVSAARERQREAAASAAPESFF